MSRIGKEPVAVPAGVTVKVDGRKVAVKGKLGELSYELPAGIDAKRLSSDSKGDAVMPYGDNEKSRVAIVIAAEK